MKQTDILLLFMVVIISGLLFNLLQGKLSNGYIALIIIGFGFGAGSISIFFKK